MILITGISGRVGSAAARHLLHKNVAVAGFTRDRSKTGILESEGANITRVDGLEELKPETFEHVDAVILVTGNGPQQKEHEIGLAQCASGAGVNRIIKISSLEASPHATAPFPKAHYDIEQSIGAMPVQLQCLRPNFFMENLLLFAVGISKANVLSLPLGKAKTAMVAAEDVGVAAAEMAINSDYDKPIYTLCGENLCDFYEIAAQLSLALGRKIEYVPQSLQEFHAMLSKAIPSAWHVDAVTDLFAEIAAGSLDVASPDLENLLGRKPTSMKAFIAARAAAFASQ